MTTSPSVGPDGEKFSPSRGREIAVDAEAAKSSGRGGVGNIRSLSRTRAASRIPEGYPATAALVGDRAANEAAYEKHVIEEAGKQAVVSHACPRILLTHRANARNDSTLLDVVARVT